MGIVIHAEERFAERRRQAIADRQPPEEKAKAATQDQIAERMRELLNKPKL